MDKVLERLKNELASEESRYAYADSATNAFLTGQIKALREDRGLTQEQLADLVGTQQSGISRWQNSGYSSCKVETLRKFARAFGVRLRITFEEFGTLSEDVRGFTKKRLAHRRFEDDPALKKQAENRTRHGYNEAVNPTIDRPSWTDGNTMQTKNSQPSRDMRMVSSSVDKTDMRKAC